jgi:hypothetical protein
MLIFWLLFNEKKAELKKVDGLMKIVMHTLASKTILYASTFLFSVLFGLILIVSTIFCSGVYVLRFCCFCRINEFKLSTANCDALELQLMEDEMKRGKDVQSDWENLNVKINGLECILRLHSIIYTGNNNRNHDNINNNNDTHEKDNINNKESNKGQKYKNNKKKKRNKPVLFWLHGVGGTAMLSFGLSGIIDQLGDEYDIYALDLPGFGRSAIEWGDKKDTHNISGYDLIELYIEAIRLYLDIKDLDSIYLVGHSFGAFHAVNFAHRYGLVRYIIPCTDRPVLPLNYILNCVLILLIYTVLLWIIYHYYHKFIFVMPIWLVYMENRFCNKPVVFYSSKHHQVNIIIIIIDILSL